MIVHYMQPHFPYLSLGKLGKGAGKNPYQMPNGSLSGGGLRKDSIRGFLNSFVVEILGMKYIRKIRDFFGLSPMGPLHATLREVGKQGLKNAYEKNLRMALESILELPDSLNETIITSDHGELLGENGEYGHEPTEDVPDLKEVPWLRLKK